MQVSGNSSFTIFLSRFFIKAPPLCDVPQAKKIASRFVEPPIDWVKPPGSSTELQWLELFGWFDKCHRTPDQ
jgi:hypothetical protein